MKIMDLKWKFISLAEKENYKMRNKHNENCPEFIVYRLSSDYF